MVRVREISKKKSKVPKRIPKVITLKSVEKKNIVTVNRGFKRIKPQSRTKLHFLVFQSLEGSIPVVESERIQPQTPWTIP